MSKKSVEAPIKKTIPKEWVDFCIQDLKEDEEMFAQGKYTKRGRKFLAKCYDPDSYMDVRPPPAPAPAPAPKRVRLAERAVAFLKRAFSKLSPKEKAAVKSSLSGISGVKRKARKPKAKCRCPRKGKR